MARKSTRIYDPQTGEWTKSTTTTKKSEGTKSADTGSSDKLTSDSDGKKSSDGKTKKKYNYIKYNTLSGSLSFIVNEKTIKLKAGDTVKLAGLGKYLSGNYYVKDVTRQISSNGYSHSATLIKTDVGATLKTVTKSKDKKATTKKEKSSPSKDNAQRTYNVKKGDNLYNIAKKFYGDSKKYTKIYDANTKKPADPKHTYPGQVLVIP